MKNIGLSSIGVSIPEKILTNYDLEKMVETTDEWIVSRTGIRERRIIGPNEKISDFTTEAARVACLKGDLAPEKVDFIISSTIAPDRISPAQSFEIAAKLKIYNAFCFDLNAACSGFIYGLSVAESLLKSREDITSGLVTSGEQISMLTDYSDRNSCVLFGDAAAAVVLTKDNPQHSLIYTELGADPALSEEVLIGGYRDLLDGRRSDFYFRQNGKVVFKFAVNKIKELYNRIPGKVGLKPEQIDYIIPHQANIRIIEAAAKDISVGKTQVISNIEKYGNTSSASIGVALHDSWDRFKKGDYIMLIGFGGGLSWGAALIEW
jgi:3-oxoacyl-[acyl-carrier-protein] synthase III